MSLPPPILHLTHMKAGSQWVYQVLAAAFPGRVARPLPDNHHVTAYPILPGLVYPTVYLARDELLRCEPPPGWRGVVVIRDVRDTLVSMYYSYRHSHPDLDDPALVERLSLIRRSSYEEGIRWCMRARLPDFARIQRSWLESDDVPVVRFEHLVADPVSGFMELLGHCGLKTTARQVRGLLRPASFQANTGREPGTEDATAHNRKGIVGDWRNHLRGELLDEFKSLYDEHLILTGYEPDARWGNPGETVARPPSLPPAEAPGVRSASVIAAAALRRERTLIAAQIEDLVHASSDPLVQDQIRLGAGFHAPERDGSLAFRWAGEDAAIVVERSTGRQAGLVLDVEPGPGVGTDGYELQIVDETGAALARCPGQTARQEVVFRTAIPAGESVTLYLRCVPGGAPVGGPDLRVLNVRVFSLGWA